MRAHKFVADAGVERAKECLVSYIKHYCGLERIFIDELKQVIESVEIVKSLGGIEQAKLYISLNNNLHSVMLKHGMTSSTKIEKAIADYEAVEREKDRGMVK